MMDKIRSFFTKELIFSKPKFEISKLEKYMSNKIVYIKRNQNEDNYIPCLFIEDFNHCNKFLIIFHDKDEDIFSCQKEYELLREILKFNLMVVEYPEYSIYFNNNDFVNIIEDSLIVYDYIKSKFKAFDEDIFITGKVLGSAPSIFLGSHRNPRALFIINGFTELKKIPNSSFLSFFFENTFKNILYIDKVRCPTLFIHGKKNAFISYEHSLKLYHKCSSIKELYIVDKMTDKIINIEDDVLIPIT